VAGGTDTIAIALRAVGVEAVANALRDFSPRSL